MAADAISLSVELNKLRKKELIDLLINKKLPESAVGNVVLSVFVESFTRDSKSVEESNQSHDTDETTPCGQVCGKKQCMENRVIVLHYHRELNLTKNLINQMEKRLIDQEEIISLLKSQINKLTIIQPTPSTSIDQNKNLKTKKTTNAPSYADTTKKASAINKNPHNTIAAIEQPGTSDISNKPLTKTNESEVGYTVVNNKKRRAQPGSPVLLQGRNNSEQLKIQGADETLHWLYIGKVKGQVENDVMKSFLQENWPNHNIKCFKLKSKGRNSSFKVGVPIECKSKVLNVELWPEKVIIKDYEFFSKTTFQETGRTDNQ